MSDADENKGSVVPGQQVLTGLLEVMGIESARLKKSCNESFCWEFVTNGGNSGKAYLLAINKDISLLQAQKNASKLLKKGEIQRRVAEISSIIQRKYEQEVISFRIKALKQDRAVFFNQDGTPKKMVDMTEEERAIVDLEARWVDGGMRYIPVFASREKSAEALQKMFGMNKESLALTGKDGGAIQSNSSVTIYIPANGRD